MTDIFDHLHDAGYAVLEISSGYGRIKPKLFNASCLTLRPMVSSVD